MFDALKSEKFTRRVISMLARMDTMSERLLSELYVRGGYKPTAQSWLTFASKATLALGVVFVLAGVIFFFAYNWSELHRFAKLAIVSGLIVGATGRALMLDMRSFQAKLSLVVVAVSIGCLLAVFGQIYQTGANAYDLFLNWALLISGIVFISNFLPLWFMWLVLVNTAIILFAGQIARHWIDPHAFTGLFFVNGCALMLYEYCALKKLSHFDARWLPRMLGAFTVVSITVAASAGILTDFEYPAHFICLLLAPLGYGGTFVLYSRKIYDLSSIAVSCICAIALIFVMIIKVSDYDGAVMFLIGGLIVVGLTTASALLLKNINEAWVAKS